MEFIILFSLAIVVIVIIAVGMSTRNIPPHQREAMKSFIVSNGKQDQNEYPRTVNKLGEKVKITSSLAARYLKDYVIIDIETTGLQPAYEDIIEFVAIKIIDNQVVDTFETLIKPNKSIPSRISKMTGITNAMVSRSPQFNEVAQGITDFIGDMIIAGHNISSFDIRFLNHHLQKAGEGSLKNNYVDTLHLSRTWIKATTNHKLATLCKELNLQHEPTHRGRDDVMATKALIDYIKNIVIERDDQLLADMDPRYKEAIHEIGQMLIDNDRHLFGLYVHCTKSYVDLNKEMYGSRICRLRFGARTSCILITSDQIKDGYLDDVELVPVKTPYGFYRYNFKEYNKLSAISSAIIETYDDHCA